MGDDVAEEVRCREGRIEMGRIDVTRDRGKQVDIVPPHDTDE